MNKNVIQSMILASILVVNGSQNSIANASISGTTYNSCYSAGEKAFAVSDYVNAAENFAQALKYKPDDLRSHLKYAQSLYSLNKYDESSLHLKTVLQNSPNNILARIYLAENYIQLGNKELAKEQLDWILKVQPNHQKAKSLYTSIGGIIVKKEEASQKPTINEEKSLSETIKLSKKLDNSSDRKASKIIDEKIENNIVVEVKETKETKLANNIEDTDIITETTVAIEKSDIKESNIKACHPEEPKVEESKTEETMTFTPYIASENKKLEQSNKIQEKPKMPLACENIQNTDLKSFFALTKNSYIVNLEKARYEIESGNIESAAKTIEVADKLAKAKNNNRNILETQIFKSLVYIYKCDYTNFGKHLMTLKPVLSTESYQSFLDIYSKADSLNNEDDKRRLSAGVAIGAGHYPVAVSLLKPVFDNNPNDVSVYEMLLESQLNSFDYKGAEETLKKYIEVNPNVAEANFNLARFYLTANYNPELAKKYAKIASELSPEDARPKIISALTDYAEGKVKEGINEIKQMLPNLEDTSMKAICERLISDGENFSKDSNNSFVSVVALPGSKFSDPSTLRLVGEDDLKAGSYFTALDKFKKADEKVEMGRVFLGLASYLTSANEMEVASIAAGYGLKLIKEDMSRGKNIARASLYKALYDYERGDRESAYASIDLGLNCKDLDLSTYNKLVALYDNLNL